MNSKNNFNPYHLLDKVDSIRTDETLNLRKHLDLIAVHSPYLALDSLLMHNGRIFARFPIQAFIKNEIGPVTTAETGRHMAILGSIALAAANPVKQQHYYLALHADVNRIMQSETHENDLVGIINTCAFDKKRGRVTGEVINSEGKAIYEVSVDYSVLHHSLFTRLFKHGYRAEQEVYDKNPYLNPVHLDEIKLGFECCSATIGQVDPFDCYGHFANYPALPVARLGGALTRLAGVHYNFVANDTSQKYVISKAEITAHYLPFAGEEIFLESHIVRDMGSKGIELRSVARNGASKEVAELRTLITKPIQSI